MKAELRLDTERSELSYRASGYHRMVKVGLDATPLMVPTGGVRRYTAELCRALGDSFPGDEIWLLSDQIFGHPYPSVANLRTGRRPLNMLERRWWLWGLRREISRLNLDVFHGTDFSVPYLPLRPSVMTLHDLSPWLDPKWHPDADRVRRRTPLLLRLGRATMVITPSEAVRREAIERFHLSPERLVAVPHAASCIFRPVAVDSRRAPFFLYVGTLEPRKNVPLLIEVWREVRKKIPVDLVIAGRTRADFPEIAAEPGLELLGSVPDSDLPALYSGAVACVYPSHYEGFGLPVLEAMQCGAPVITSRDPAISEVVADAAARVDANDRRAWVDAMMSAFTDSEWRAGLREQALRRAAQFSWANTAKRTREVYEEAIRRF